MCFVDLTASLDSLALATNTSLSTSLSAFLFISACTCLTAERHAAFFLVGLGYPRPIVGVGRRGISAIHIEWRPLLLLIIMMMMMLYSK